MSSATESLPHPESFLPEASTTCDECGFELWTPIWRLNVARAGLYDDARFPGRLIVSLNDHYDHLDEMPSHLLAAFMADVSEASKVLRWSLGADRVNVAVLGNQESHVHAHVIPRKSSDPRPNHAPWQDPRPRTNLSLPEREVVMACLLAHPPLR